MDYDRAVGELEALVETLEREDDERALMLLELVDAIHRPGLERLAAGDRAHPRAEALLGMYELAELGPELVVEEALDEVRPYIHSHGGEVELVAVEGGVVRVRLSGACHGCAASAMTLQRGIETVLREHLPDFERVIAEPPDGESASGDGGSASDAGDGPQLIQLEGLDVKRPVFSDLGVIDATEHGEGLKGIEVDGIKVLLASVAGERYAFRDGCPVDGRSLAGGRLTETVIVCPWHNCAYDARSGKRLDEPEEPALAVLPVAIREGRVQVAVNVA